MKQRLLFWLAALLALLPLSADATTWSFEWNKSHSDATSQGFYNFGNGSEIKDVYTAELNDIVWNISSDGTHKYAYTAKSGQTIGTTSEPSTHTSLWTTAIAGRITAVRVQARTNKQENTADLTVTVNGSSYVHGEASKAALTNTITDYEFKPSLGAQEGKIEICIDPTSDAKGTLYIKKVEVDYEVDESAVVAPTFSVSGGTYDEPQSVSISANGLAEGTYTTYYTTDGSNPRIEGTRSVYTKPIDITQTTTLNAAVLVGTEYSSVTTAKYVIRKDPQLRFKEESISLISGEDGYSDLLNPNKLKPITYKSSAWNVCSVDEYGELHSSYVTKTTTATITASFAGNDEYRPGEAQMTVTVIAKQPLATPTVTPQGGTFDAPVEVTVKTDDENAVTIWYSTKAKDQEEFEDDYTKSTIVEGKSTTFTIDHSCTLYVMTRGNNTNSPVVTSQFVINEPLTADFTTDRAKKAYYTEDFDSEDELTDWIVGEGWQLKNKNFSSINTDDKSSISIGYDDGKASSTLESPAIDIRKGSSVEFYAYFQAPYLIYGKWTFSAVDTETGKSTTLLNAFDWAQENEYTGPNWNLFSFDLSEYEGKNVKFVFNYPFGGEDLAIDGFRLVESNSDAADVIRIFEGEKIHYHSLAKGEPDAIEWTFPGGDITSSTDADPVVTYNTAGTYDVTLTASRGSETVKNERKSFVVVAQKAPTAKIGLPEEGYESPYVGVFVPTNVPVTFRDLSTGNPTEWNWKFQFADIEESNEQNPVVTFVKKGTVSVGLTAKNAAGQSNDILQYAIQAGGAQNVWNIGIEENKNIEKVAMGWYGNYAGSNWLGMEKFAELYKAPLAEATIDSVDVFFATTTTVSPDAEINLTINAVAENGEPGEVLATTNLKASELKYDEANVVPTTFKFDKPVAIAKGTRFFVVVGPFPNTQLEEAPYTSDDIAIYCVRRHNGERCTAWHYLEDQDEKGNGLGTYKWFENNDDPLSMAIAPILNYETTTGIKNTTNATAGQATVKAVYTLDGMAVSQPQKGTLYIVKYSDGNCKKIVWE